ncbi:MAG: hypothetical protein U5K54_05775 [Cytophagales bacterium]|nr:hypothetical protein [Cytophagales bacterium]
MEKVFSVVDRLPDAEALALKGPIPKPPPADAEKELVRVSSLLASF